MSDPIDSKALEEYLKGGSEISQRYREIGADEAPPELDRCVLEQARAAIAQDKRERSRSLLRWSAPVALAASVVLVLAVVMEGGVQREAVFATKPVAEGPNLPRASDASLMEDVAPAEQPSPAKQPAPANPEIPKVAVESPPPAAIAREQAAMTVPEKVRVTAKAARRGEEPQSAPAVVTMPETERTSVAQLDSVRPVPAPPSSLTGSPSANQSARQEADGRQYESDELAEIAVTGSRVRRAPPRSAGPRDTIAQRSFGGDEQDAVPASTAEHEDPEQWLEEIRELRRAAKADEADREWQRFRAAFPDYQVRDDDIAAKKP